MQKQADKGNTKAPPPPRRVSAAERRGPWNNQTEVKHKQVKSGL